ncbi:MAG TPA: hypothetical protein VJB82_03645 [Candidatus Peribacterales bacterium]|nr:hypothetical protein [Candidatus Peribacterales bacterium]
MKIRLLLILFSLSFLLSTPSLLRLPRIIPFLDAEVRAASPSILTALREQGLWLVNTDLLSVKKDAEGVCFTFEHRYTGMKDTFHTELLTTCTYD